MWGLEASIDLNNIAQLAALGSRAPGVGGAAPGLEGRLSEALVTICWKTQNSPGKQLTISCPPQCRTCANEPLEPPTW
jgi:hypothetical protein